MNGYDKLRKLRRNPLRTAICAVIFLMVNDPESTFLAKTWPAYGRIATMDFSKLEARVVSLADSMTQVAIASANAADAVRGFAVDYGTDPEAAQMSAEAAVKYDRVRAQRVPEPLTDAEHAELDGMLAELRAKPKRIRVRAKPLTAADIVPGGVYVPKRGNDKTPNFYVFGIDVTEREVTYSRTPDPIAGRGAYMDADEFLALVARRVEPQA